MNNALSAVFKVASDYFQYLFYNFHSPLEIVSTETYFVPLLYFRENKRKRFFIHITHTKYIKK